MSLLVKGSSVGQKIVEVTPESARWKYVGFSAFRLEAGESISFDASKREQCFVVLQGNVTIDIGSMAWREIGTRNSVFDDVSPAAVYLPAGHAVTVTAHCNAEIAIASAPASRSDLAPRLIKPEDMNRSVRGQGSNTRYICDILPATEVADSLLVVEVRTPAGHSSSYPPHKHDQDAIPVESVLEETYYHRLNPSQGFAFQRVYTDDRSIDESMAVEDHGVVMVPRGYHPVVMPHGYEGYYLNVMAGPKRQWHFKNDPSHEWLIKT
ncbi:5-deoxy-glucuronate isomerase [Stenotrophobium rhamnosiphilum]|uniref:5-deoxy-glucuronate isomerase n=1 Tax=Stenotrophobium rhamnosiphilum TaxID=2029166 RepID=A0A2T5MEC2_9GAMM|nr:5-deoxy-glucuronate isomerase [Stenotrophobium rhamnosiphilum]PTU30899.1 5-deoxy-glucuronate isomerase [Stenotrophobium rhamnosiphilum]